MSMQALTAIKGAKVTNPQKSILFVLADHANTAGECRLLVSTLMAEACLSRGAVLQNLDKLASLGLIEKGPLTGRSRTYRLVMNADAGTVAETVAETAPDQAPVIDLPAPAPDAARGTPDVPLRSTRCTSEVHQMDLESNKNPVSNPKGATAAKSKPKTDPHAIPLPDCLPLPVWREWIAYRRERRLTCSPTTLTRQIALLTELHSRGHDPRTVIDNSIRNGWQGLFEPKAARTAPEAVPVRRMARRVIP